LPFSRLVPYIKQEHPALQVETKGGDKINTLPSKKLSLAVNVDQIKEKQIVPDTILPFLSSKLNINVAKNAIHKSDLMILDLIASNNWVRPIYFTYTALNSMSIDISHMVVQEGYTYRLLPIQLPDHLKHTANSEAMFANMMSTYQWRGTKNKKVYYSSYHKNQMIHTRSDFNQLPTTLLEEGNLKKAKEALERSLDVIPNDTTPYDVASINTARIFVEIGEKEIGLGIARTMVKRVDKELNYYTTHQKNESEKIRQNYMILNMLSQTIREAGDLDEANKTEILLRKYYDRISEI
jgi:tetratricopeptide (TPR) repeat protein